MDSGFRPAELRSTAGASNVKAVGKEPVRMLNGKPVLQVDDA